MLKINGSVAVVISDNVLFEGGAGETIRKKLLAECYVHTLLRLPTGIFYALGVKANVIFFDRKSGREEPWTDTHWIYNLRTNLHFTLKENPLSFEDLKDFIKSYNPENRRKRSATERFKPYKYEDLIKRDKVCLDIFWIKDKSLEDSENFLEPDVIAGAIAVFKLQSSNFQGYMKISKRNEGYILYLVIWITQNKDSVKEGEEQPHDAGPPISNILLFGIIFFFNFSCFSPEKLRRKKGGEK